MIRIAKRTVRDREELAIVTDNATLADSRLEDSDTDINIWFVAAPSIETVKAILKGFEDEGWVAFDMRGRPLKGHVTPKSKRDGPGWTIAWRDA